MTTEQRIKAYALMLNNGEVENKKDALLSLGYAESTARNPQAVERTETFKAIAEGLGLITAGHVAKISEVLDKRDFNVLPTKDLVDVYAKLAGTFTRLVPLKEDRDTNLRSVYAKVIDADTTKDSP